MTSNSDVRQVWGLASHICGGATAGFIAGAATRALMGGSVISGVLEGAISGGMGAVAAHMNKDIHPTGAFLLGLLTVAASNVTEHAILREPHVTSIALMPFLFINKRLNSILGLNGPSS